MVEHLVAIRFRRIVAALPPAGDVTALLRLAARLAAAGRAELSAVVLEDVMLQQVSRLSVARHVAVGTAMSLPLTPDMLRWSMAAAIRRMEALLSRLPEATNLVWRLQGEAAETPADDVGADDVLLLSGHAALPQSWSRRSAAPQILVAAVVADETIAQRRILIAFDGSVEADRALALARLLAGRQPAEYLIAIPEDLSQAKRARLAESMAGAASGHSVLQLDRLDPDSLVDAARHWRAGLLLVPADPATVSRLQALLAPSIAAA